MKSKFCGVCLLAGLLGSPAFAGLLPVNVDITREGANTRYEYSVVLESDTLLRKGDYFTIYDFAGYIANSNTQPTNFSFTTQPVGLTPPHVLPKDDPSIPNLTFTYTGNDTQVGQLSLGNFSALSSYVRSREDFFTAQSHREVDGKLNSNITDTQVPVPCHPPAVPEPSSLLLLALAAPLALGVKAYRRMRTVTV